MKRNQKHTEPWWLSGLERCFSHSFILELKVEGSNPATSHAHALFECEKVVGQERIIKSRINSRFNAHAQMNELIRSRMRTRLDFRYDVNSSLYVNQYRTAVSDFEEQLGHGVR